MSGVSPFPLVSHKFHVSGGEKTTLPASMLTNHNNKNFATSPCWKQNPKLKEKTESEVTHSRIDINILSNFSPTLLHCNVPTRTKQKQLTPPPLLLLVVVVLPPPSTAVARPPEIQLKFYCENKSFLGKSKYFTVSPPPPCTSSSPGTTCTWCPSCRRRRPSRPSCSRARCGAGGTWSSPRPWIFCLTIQCGLLEIQWRDSPAPREACGPAGTCEPGCLKEKEPKINPIEGKARPKNCFVHRFGTDTTYIAITNITVY